MQCSSTRCFTKDKNIHLKYIIYKVSCRLLTINNLKFNKVVFSATVTTVSCLTEHWVLNQWVRCLPCMLGGINLQRCTKSYFHSPWRIWCTEERFPVVRQYVSQGGDGEEFTTIFTIKKYLSNIFFLKSLAHARGQSQLLTTEEQGVTRDSKHLTTTTATESQRCAHQPPTKQQRKRYFHGEKVNKKLK